MKEKILLKQKINYDFRIMHSMRYTFKNGSGFGIYFIKRIKKKHEFEKEQKKAEI